MKVNKKEKVTKEYEVIDKCFCDRCGSECQIRENDFMSKRTQVDISLKYVGEVLFKDLCPLCTRELLNWFKADENTADILSTLYIWEQD